MVNDYKYNKCVFNIVRYIEKSSPNEKDKIFTYITNIPINDNNIKEIIELGRRRWKIENQGFNNQKNIYFDITHMCSLNYNAMKVHYLFIQFDSLLIEKLDKLANFYHTSTDYLLYRTDVRNPYPKSIVNEKETVKS